MLAEWGFNVSTYILSIDADTTQILVCQCAFSVPIETIISQINFEAIIAHKLKSNGPH